MSSARDVKARIHAIATHVPDTILSNDDLAAAFMDSWSADKIFEKTGIRERRIAAPGETAGDLAEQAAQRLFAEHGIDPASIDFLIFCSQAPDYILPTTACVLQDRLGLPRSIGALDVNLGCSGFVYGLSLAAGLIAAGAAKTVLLLTADTYSKFINAQDRSVRTLFGDGAAATLIVADNGGTSSVGPFTFGTDGRGANDLIVETGGAREERSRESGRAVTDEFDNVRSRDNLYMNGAAVMTFTLREVPKVWNELKAATEADDDSYDYVVMHQANKFMLDTLRRKLKLPADKVPYHFENIGNTVSSTIPFALQTMIADGRLQRGRRLALIGFGVGLSWAACSVTY